MKHIYTFLCLFLLSGVPCAYGETITYTFDSGIKYVGEVKNGKFHGQGTMTFPDSTKYVGEWKDHKIHGQGTKTDFNGNRYFG